MDAMVGYSSTARRSLARLGPTKSRRPRLLVVDEEVSNLSSIRAYLVMKNFDVDTASTVEETELRLLLRDYDLVILPDGQLIPVIREINPKSRMILMTGSRSPSSEQREALGADRVILKPVQLRDLLAEVTTLLAPESSKADAQ